MKDDKGDLKKLIERKRLEDSLRHEFEQSLHERIERYLHVHIPSMLPYRHFAPVLAECEKLYRDGYFSGCITLAQAVAEAMVRFIWERNSCSGEGDFEGRLEKLHTRRLISRRLKKWLLKVWQGRNDYHHLNPSVGPDTNDPDMDAAWARHRAKLERLARAKTRLLLKAAAEAFRWTAEVGKLVLEKLKYWEAT